MDPASLKLKESSVPVTAKQEVTITSTAEVEITIVGDLEDQAIPWVEVFSADQRINHPPGLTLRVFAEIVDFEPRTDMSAERRTKSVWHAMRKDIMRECVRDETEG